MHEAALTEMTKVVYAEKRNGLNVLDVGSFDVNGTYRPLIEGRGWQYTGLDVCAGPNVDIVSHDPFNFPLDAESYDVVISGSTMEHVTAIWRWVPELVRVLKPGGLLAIITHWQIREHRYPVDCWRIMPDGMKFILNETGQLTDIRAEITNDTDIIGTARKVEA